MSSHTFRTADDLIHAVRLAAEEVNRGVLSRMKAESRELGNAAQEALDSSLQSGAMPDLVQYRFRCEICGDQFLLVGDTRTGTGAWTRTSIA